MDQQAPAPSPALAYEELKGFIKFGVDAGNVLGKAFQGSSFDISQISSIFSLLSEGKDALSHMADMKIALAGLTEQQRADLYTYVMTHLHMPEADIQAEIEKSMLTVCKLHEIYLLWK